MFRSATALIAILLVGGSGRAFAQESTPGPGIVEVTVIPGGATFFTSKGNGSSFGNYNVGGALTYNINRIVGIEGEVNGSIGISQNLTDGGFRGKHTTPNTVSYTGNVVLSAPTHSSFVPYATVGVGRPHDASGGKRRRQQHRDIPDGQRRRWAEVVRARRSLGPPRRLPVSSPRNRRIRRQPSSGRTPGMVTECTAP